MMKNILFILFTTMVLCFTLQSDLHARLGIDIESGIVFSGYNDIRIPNKTGTLFSFSEELKTESAPFVRARIFYTFNERHAMAVLFAPLELDAAGRLDRELIFEGVSFPADIPLTASYRFDSYRATYLYTLAKSPKFHFACPEP